MSAAAGSTERRARNTDRQRIPVRLATHAMGTRFEIVLGDMPSRLLRAAGEAAIEEIERCHRQLSRFASDSLLSHIHRVACQHPVRLDDDTFALFQDALAVHAASGGAFDVAVGDSMDVVLDRSATVRAATADTLVRDRGMSAAFALDSARRTILLRDAHVSLDLGAIAKGHALDLAARLLRENGVDCALLHGGTSSVLAVGAPPDTDGWQVRIAPDRSASVITLRDRALSVSCAAGPRDIAAGRGRPHLVDGRNRTSVTSTTVVAVVGPSARLTDAWATAIAVLGERPAALDHEWETFFLEPSPEVC